MPAATLNSVSFAGGVFDAETVRRAPQKIIPKPRKIGDVVEGADGTQNFMQRAQKSDWELRWEQVPETTRAAVRAIFDLSTTFTAVLPSGTYTVQCHKEDYTEDPVLTIPGPIDYYDVTLIIHQT